MLLPYYRDMLNLVVSDLVAYAQVGAYTCANGPCRVGGVLPHPVLSISTRDVLCHGVTASFCSMSCGGFLPYPVLFVLLPHTSAHEGACAASVLVGCLRRPARRVRCGQGVPGRKPLARPSRKSSRDRWGPEARTPAVFRMAAEARGRKQAGDAVRTSL